MLSSGGSRPSQKTGQQRVDNRHSERPRLSHWMLGFVESDLSRESAGSPKRQVELDVSRRQLATRDGARFNLTKLEFELMSYFSKRPGSVVTRDELLREAPKRPSGTGSMPRQSSRRTCRPRAADS